MEVSILLWVSGSIYGFERGSVDIFHYLQVQFLSGKISSIISL